MNNFGDGIGKAFEGLYKLALLLIAFILFMLLLRLL